MIIKQSDGRLKDIETLQELLTHPEVSAETVRKIELEIKFIQSGVRGEKEAAYEIEFHYGQSENWAIIHDLRLVHDGRVAQIDHIVINRFLDVWVCESKRFNEGVAINEHGECAAFYGGKPYGVPSPFEQNRKHIIVLKALFDSGAVELPKRLGFTIKPEIKSLILISKNARIQRPKSNVEGIDDILKVDQIKPRIHRAVDFDNNSNVKFIQSVAKIISPNTLESLAKRLTALHVPSDFDWHARFGLPKQIATKSRRVEIQAPSAKVEVDKVESKSEAEKKSKLACSTCGEGVTYNVAKFCWFNKAKFGGNVYCMECQKKV